MYILSMDLSLNGSAFAVGKVVGGALYIEELTTVDNKTRKYANLTHGEKLKRIGEELIGLLARYDITEIVRERGFSRHNKSTQALYKVHGVVDYVLEQYGYRDTEPAIPATTVKKLVTGSGKASKEEVMRALEQYVGRQEYSSDDESDAVAVAVALRKIRDGE